jgi:hypothetical protein
MRLPAVVVMQAAQHGAGDEIPNHLWVGPSPWLARDSLPNALVGPSAVEVFLVLLHQPIQMSLTQDQQVVQTLSPHTAQKSFTDRICLWLYWPNTLIRQAARG